MRNLMMRMVDVMDDVRVSAVVFFVTGLSFIYYTPLSIGILFLYYLLQIRHSLDVKIDKYLRKILPFYIAGVLFSFVAQYFSLFCF